MIILILLSPLPHPFLSLCLAYFWLHLIFIICLNSFLGRVCLDLWMWLPPIIYLVYGIVKETFSSLCLLTYIQLDIETIFSINNYIILLLKSYSLQFYIVVRELASLSSLFGSQ